MLRIVFFLLVICLLETKAYGQYHLGFRVGNNFTIMQASTSGKEELARANEFGAVFSYQNEGRFSFVAEGNLLTKKWSISYSEELQKQFNGISEQEWQYRYAGVTLLTQWKLIDTQYFFFYLQGGVFLNYLINIDQKITKNNEVIESVQNISYLEDNRLEYGIAAGGGLGLNTQYVAILLDTKINLSFSNVKNPFTRISMRQSKFASVPVGIHVLIPFGKNRNSDKSE